MHDCNQCGKCCIKYGGGDLSATAQEIHDWEIFDPDIAKHVANGKIWMDPISRQQLPQCPWLQARQTSVGTTLYECAIYDDRPEDCRHYPTTVAEMVRDGCEMIEVRDLDNPAQAQRELDRLMANSRPPLA